MRTHPKTVGDDVAALKGAVQEVSSQFLQQGTTRPKGDVLDAPPVSLHSLNNLPPQAQAQGQTEHPLVRRWPQKTGRLYPPPAAC